MERDGNDGGCGGGGGRGGGKGGIHACIKGVSLLLPGERGSPLDLLILFCRQHGPVAGRLIDQKRMGTFPFHLTLTHSLSLSFSLDMSIVEFLHARISNI